MLEWPPCEVNETTPMVLAKGHDQWHHADRAAIAVPSAWLAKVVTNLCLNRLASARVQRERYVGPWLPEPVLTSDGTLGPLDTAERRDSVSLAVLVLLEGLAPTSGGVRPARVLEPEEVPAHVIFHRWWPRGWVGRRGVRPGFKYVL
jgi:hypothetical protein